VNWPLFLVAQSDTAPAVDGGFSVLQRESRRADSPRVTMVLVVGSRAGGSCRRRGTDLPTRYARETPRSQPRMSHAPSPAHPMTDGSAESVRYRMYAWWKALVVTIAIGSTLAAAALVAASSGSPGNIAFLVVWVLGAVFSFYQVTARVGISVTVAGDTLEWAALWGVSRSVPVADLVKIRPSRGGGSAIEVVELTDGSTLAVWVRKGFADLAAELAARRPGLPVKLGDYSYMCERLQRRSGFSRNTIP
jgi:hypothetical protein